MLRVSLCFNVLYTFYVYINRYLYINIRKYVFLYNRIYIRFLFLFVLYINLCLCLVEGCIVDLKNGLFNKIFVFFIGGRGGDGVGSL